MSIDELVKSAVERLETDRQDLRDMELYKAAKLVQGFIRVNWHRELPFADVSVALERQGFLA